MAAKSRLQVQQSTASDGVPGHDGFTDTAYLENPSLSAGISAASPGFYAAAPPTQTLYLTEASDTAAISVNDIHQGQLGDCFLLSSFGEEALFHPTAIANMIHDNGNGTESVTLYLDKNGRLPNFTSTSFKATTVTIDNAFSSSSVNSGAGQDVVGRQKEIWSQVLEKAVAVLDGGYGAISAGGNPMIAMEELTGHAASYMQPASLSLTTLQNFIAAGDLITMDTSSGRSLPYGLISNHAYMFEKLIGSDGSAMVMLHNPWGYNQPSAIPLAQLARSGVIEVDIGRTS